MNITHMKTNHITNPLGFAVTKPTFTYAVTDTIATTQIAAQVEIALDESFTELVFDSGITEDMDSLAYSPDLELAARTRYFWRVRVWNELGEKATSETAWFETAKQAEPWTAKWITPEPGTNDSPSPPKNVRSQRAYRQSTGVHLWFRSIRIGAKRSQGWG